MNNLICRKIKEVCSVDNPEQVIPLHEPDFRETKAWDYVKECIDSGWVSSAGNWVNRFERMIESYTGCEHAIAVTNGTVAIRLALYISGVKPGDEVITSPMSFVATANAICHLGAVPHFVDIETERYGMCPNALADRLDEIGENRDGDIYNKESGRRISCVLPIHIFGNPLRIKEVVDIADRWGLPVVEDAAEALGSWVGNNHCGSFGKVGCFSFNGNKIITTGGGGALVTNEQETALRARHLSTTAKRQHPWEFFHDEIGWNDRMPNINAALGVGQLERMDIVVKRKRDLHRKYVEAFGDVDGVRILNIVGDSPNNWLISMTLVEGNQKEVEEVRNSLLEFAQGQGLMLRPVWRLLSELPMFVDVPRGELINAYEMAPRLVSLPSSPNLVSNSEDIY